MDENRTSRDLIMKLACMISHVLKRWKLIVLIALIGAMGFDTVRTLMYHPRYQASVSATLGSEQNTYSQLDTTQAYIRSLSYIFNGQNVQSYLQERLGNEDSTLTCSVNSVNDTNVVNISVQADTRRDAWFGLQYVLDWYRTNGDKYHFDYDLNVTQTNPISEAPVSANSHVRNLMMGGIGGGVFIAAVLLLLAYFSDTIKTPAEITTRIDCRMLARLPKEHKRRGIRFWKKNREALLITSLKTSFRYKEAVKKLRSRIEESSRKHGYQTIMVTSVMENEGKSSIAANLAISLAKGGHHVLMIDADIRKPSLDRILNMETEHSLNAALSGKDWKKEVMHSERFHMDVLCSIQDLENAEKLLSSEQMKKLLEEAKQSYEFVIVDTSPAAGLSDPLIISEHCDASLLVIRQNLAGARRINDAIDRLVTVRNNLIGCIYNGAVFDPLSEQKAYGYRYRYNRYSNEGRRRQNG